MPNSSARPSRAPPARVRSEWAMPRPAVIQLTSPGRIGCSVPRLSRCDDLALEQVGHGGEPDVRVRAHVDALPEQELGRPHLVEEDERPDHLPRADGSARRTSKPPRSRARGTITVSIGLAPPGALRTSDRSPPASSWEPPLRWPRQQLVTM